MKDKGQVAIGEKSMLVSKLIQDVYPEMKIEAVREKEVKALGYISSPEKNICAFVEEKRFVRNIPDNVDMLIIKKDMEEAVRLKKGIGYVIVDHPRNVFWGIHNSLAGSHYVREQKENQISKSAVISPKAEISSHNVVIGDNVVIEAFATIYENTTIGDDCKISSGCRIGGVGFQENKNGKYIETVNHYGGVTLKKGVELQSNSCIDRALFPWQDTVIGSYTKIDNLVHIAHAVKIGDACMLTANVTIAGFCQIGDEVWIGLGSILRNGIHVGNRARINMGSVVVDNVEEDMSVSGNYAIDHTRFLFHQMKLRK